MAAVGFNDDQTGSFTNLAAGTIVSNYEGIFKIGAGRMREVYIAEDTLLDREVALKFLSLRFPQDEVACTLSCPEAARISSICSTIAYMMRLFLPQKALDIQPLVERAPGGQQS